MSDVLAHFNCLDELTQVIYQGINKFVLLSNVTDDTWNLHVGLLGEQGRWWQGSITGDDVQRRFGSKMSDKFLDTFADSLAEAIIQGETSISDWSTEPGAAIKLTFNPSSNSKKPMHVPLVEMAAEDAAAHATQVFLAIALQAQSRKCRLYPSTLDFAVSTISTSNIATIPTYSLKRKEQSSETEAEIKDQSSSKVEGSTSFDKSTKTRIPASIEPDMGPDRANVKPVKAQLQAKSSTSTIQAKKPVAPVPLRPKSTSLANPNKKVRRIQALQFESDDE